MDVEAAIGELREQNSRLKRLLAEAELEKDALREVAKGKYLSRTAKRAIVVMLIYTMGLLSGPGLSPAGG